MMTAVFTIYLLGTIATLLKKRKLAIGIILFGLALGLFIFWFHITDKLGIRL